MKKFRYVTYCALCLLVCVVLGMISLDNRQNELALLCQKFNEDITRPESQWCVEPVLMTPVAFTFISQQNDIASYEYIRMDPTKRIEGRTRIWFSFLHFTDAGTCPRPTWYDKWRMPIWLTGEESACYLPDTERY